MKRVIAIAFSDLHINDWSKFNQDNERTLNHFRVLSDIVDLCYEYNCPALFCGDLFHKPEMMSQELYSILVSKLKSLQKKYKKKPFDIFGISGNHDMKFTVKAKTKPISWFNILSQQYDFLESLDFSQTLINNGRVCVYGIPYIDHNIDLDKYIVEITKSKDFKEHKNILLLHTDYPGAKDTDNSEVGISENLNLNLLNKFDLVLLGHIHKPQRLSKKVYMIGAPLQQRRTDRDCDLGYWLIFEDLSMRFIVVEKYPKFIDVTDENDIQEDGNYYTVISQLKTQEAQVSKNNMSKGLSKKRMVRRYLRNMGIADSNKERILLNIIKESEE